MKIRIEIILILVLIMSSCEHHILKSREFKNDFKNHVSNADSVLYDGDFLHPTYAYLKNGNITGIEFNANPECGKYTRRYFLDKNEKISKIVIEKDFFSDHCGEPYDSIYVIDLLKKQILVYTKSSNGIKIENDKILEDKVINIAEYKEKINKWHFR